MCQSSFRPSSALILTLTLTLTTHLPTYPLVSWITLTTIFSILHLDLDALSTTFNIITSTSTSIDITTVRRSDSDSGDRSDLEPKGSHPDVSGPWTENEDMRLLIGACLIFNHMYKMLALYWVRYLQPFKSIPPKHGNDKLTYYIAVLLYLLNK